MLRSLGAAVSLVAAFAVFPALASEKENSPEQTVSAEPKTETSSNSAPATPLPSAADGTERKAEDPFAAALKDRLTQATRGEGARERPRVFPSYVANLHCRDETVYDQCARSSKP